MGLLNRIQTRILLVIIVLIPAIAQAEVMDKEPTIGFYWLVALVIAAMGFVVCRFWPWFGVVTLPIASLGLLSEVLDPYVGPAIRLEAGLSYVAQVYLCTMLAIVGSVAGIMVNLRKRRKADEPPNKGIQADAAEPRG